jgi:hypothetical protein
MDHGAAVREHPGPQAIKLWRTGAIVPQADR